MISLWFLPEFPHGTFEGCVVPVFNARCVHTGPGPVGVEGSVHERVPAVQPDVGAAHVGD